MADDKYIRTFGGDLETLKGGGTPNLAPLHNPQSELPVERSVEPSSSVIEEPKLSPLKTYAGDFRERMKETQASSATVLAAEQDSSYRTVQSQPEKVSHNNLIFSIAGGVLLIGAIIGAYVAYTQYLGVSAPVVVAPTATAPIFVDEREQLSGTGASLQQAINQSVARQIGQGTIRLLYLETATTSSTSVFGELGLPVPGSLTRNLQAAQSMAGVVVVDGKQSPFFILSVASYGDTFAAMLAWEPLMPRDFGKLFPLYPAPVMNTQIATTTATSTQKQKTSATTTVSTTEKAAAPTTFFDTTVANHDVRVYRDTASRDILLYGYWNQSTLVIARDTAAFTEILKRLANSRTQ